MINISNNNCCSLKQFHEQFPKLEKFILDLAEEYNQGKIPSEMMDKRIINFFSEGYMKYFDENIPGWKKMSSYRDKMIMIHTIKVLIALYSLEEFNKIYDRDMRNALKWAVLLHDIGKELEEKRDPHHSFKSAVIIASNASTLNFDTENKYSKTISNWTKLTYNAHIIKNNRIVHDFSKLPEIITGIDKMFKLNSYENYLIKAVLFHQSINTEKDWSKDVTLNKKEILKYFNFELLQTLKILIMADSWSYNLFDNNLWNKYKFEIDENISQILQYIL